MATSHSIPTAVYIRTCKRGERELRTAFEQYRTLDGVVESSQCLNALSPDYSDWNRSAGMKHAFSRLSRVLLRSTVLVLG